MSKPEKSKPSKLVECDDCGKLVPREEITWSDPYASEIYGTEVPVQWCSECTKEALEEI